MEKHVKKYLKMLGLQCTNVASSKDYVAVVSKNDVIIGYLKKKRKTYTFELYDIESLKDFPYKSIIIKPRNDDCIEGFIFLNDKENKKVYCTINEKEKICTLIEENKNQITFTPNVIYAFKDDNYYQYNVSNNKCVGKDKKEITEILQNLYNAVPDLITNMIYKYNCENHDYIYDDNQPEKDEKAKQLII